MITGSKGNAGGDLLQAVSSLLSAHWCIGLHTRPQVAPMLGLCQFVNIPSHNKQPWTNLRKSNFEIVPAFQLACRSSRLFQVIHELYLPGSKADDVRARLSASSLKDQLLSTAVQGRMHYRGQIDVAKLDAEQGGRAVPEC